MADSALDEGAWDAPAEPYFNTDADGNSVVLNETESDSHTDWTFLVFVFLWLLALVLMGTLAFAMDKSRRDRHRQAGIAPPAPEPSDEESLPKEETFAVPVEFHETASRTAMSIIPILASIIAVGLAIGAQTSCKYFTTEKVSFSNGNELFAFGPWSASIYDGTSGSQKECQSTYRNDFPVDRPMVVARVCAILASVVGITSIIAMIYLACFSSHLIVVWFRRLSWPLLVAAVAQGMLHVLISSELCDSPSTCEVDYGGLSSLTAVGYWIVAALGVAFIPLPTM